MDGLRDWHRRNCAGKLGWSTGFGAGGAGTSTVRSTRGVRGAGMLIGAATAGSAGEETATCGTEIRATGCRTGEGLKEWAQPVRSRNTFSE